MSIPDCDPSFRQRQALCRAQDLANVEVCAVRVDCGVPEEQVGQRQACVLGVVDDTQADLSRDDRVVLCASTG